MADFSGLYEHLKYLYDESLYEDVKLLADMLIGLVESSSPQLTSSIFASTSAMPCFSSVASKKSFFGFAASSSIAASSSVATTGSSPATLSSPSLSSSSSSSSSTIVQPQTSASVTGPGTTSQSSSCRFDQKDIYMIYYYYASSAFHLREFKLAENIYNKALQIYQAIQRQNAKQKTSTCQNDSDIDINLKYNLHMCLTYDKKHAEAIKILDSIPTKQRTAKIHLALGKLNHVLMNNDEAILNYKEALKLCKNSMVAIQALLNLGVKLDDLPKSSIASENECLTLFTKGKSHLISREYKEACKTFKTIDTNLTTHKSVEVLSSLAYSYYLNGEYSQAINTFEKLHRLEPTYTSRMDIYAYLLYTDKTDYDKLTILEKLSNDMHSTSINIPETWTVIGYYSLKKKSQKAKCFAENALQIDPTNVQALLLKAIALGKLKAYSESALIYRDATRLNNYFYEAYRGLVDTLLNLNHTKEAIQIASSAIKLLGYNPRTFSLYGEALSREGSTQEKSKTYLYKAIKGDPDNQESVVCLVRVCMTLSQFHEALEVLGKYIRHNSSNPRLMHIYTELMKKCNKTDEAVIYMNKASGMDPSNLQIKSLLERTEQNIELNQDETIQNFHVI